MGLTDRRPRLSWWLPDGSLRQDAYEIGLDDGRAARIESDRSVLVPWPFEPLRSRERVAWRVRVWTDAGPSDWSEPATIEAGLLEPVDWSAAWIEPDEGERRPPGERPAWLLRHEFVLARRPGGAPLRHRPRDLRDVPQRTASRRPRADARLHQLRHQPPRPDLRRHRPAASPGRTVGGDAERRLVPRPPRQQPASPTASATPSPSSASWRSATPRWRRPAPGGRRRPVRSSRPTSWPARSRTVASSRGRGGRSSSSTTASTQLTSSPAPRCGASRRSARVGHAARRRAARSSTSARTSPGASGSTTSVPPAPRSSSRTARPSTPRATSTTEHLEFDGSSLGQVDRVISAGRPDDVFEPRHTVHGFQYVRVEGHPHDSDPDDADRRRRAHRPPAHGLVPVQRRPAEPVPRDRRLELPRQRLRHPDRLPAPRALRVDGRLAGLPAERRVPLRRRRLLDQVAPRPGRRAAARRPPPQLRARPAATAGPSPRAT